MKKILCFGDSNTYGYDPASRLGDRYPLQNRWVDLLAGMLGCDVINEGQNGRTIPRREGELRVFGQILAQHTQIDLLVVMLGTNDLLQGKSVKTVAGRMESFLEQIALEKSRILLISPPPMKHGEWIPTQKLINASEQLGGEYECLAEQKGIFFVDSGEWGIGLAYDGVHFTEEGHTAFADGLCRYLKKEIKIC